MITVRQSVAQVLRVFGLGLGLAAFALAPASAQAQIDIETAVKERALGEPTAPVTIVEYASLTCPHCAHFHTTTFDALKERYIDTGKVRFIYRDFPLDGIALRAAMIARCADEEGYFALVGMLYKSQEEWSRASDPVAELRRVGAIAGVNPATFDACLASEPVLQTVLQLRQQGAGAGVNSTPTFIINDTVYPGGRLIDDFAAIIEPLLHAK